MKARKFEELIKFESLAKTDDTYKFMLKVYLDCLLKGGKLRERCYLYSCGKLNQKDAAKAFVLRGDEPLKFNSIPLENAVKIRKLMLVEFFKEMKRQGYWEIENTLFNEYDKSGKLMGWDECEDPKKVVSKTEEITTKTRYYLHKPIDINPLGEKK